MKTRSIVLAATLALSACGNPQPSKAQEGEFAQPTRNVPSDAGGMKSSFAPVVRSAAPAVVNISARSVQRVQADPFWQLFGGGVPQARVLLMARLDPARNRVRNGAADRPDLSRMTMKTRSIVLAATLALSACGNPQPSKAQEGEFAQPTRNVPSDAGGMKSSFAPVVRSAAPAVVNISARSVQRVQADPFWQLFGGGVPQARVAESVGSGVIVRSDGIVVTNNHVIQGAQQIKVVLNDRREFPATVILADERSDIAVLRLENVGERLPVLAIDDKEEQQVGDLVLAIVRRRGSPGAGGGIRWVGRYRAFGRNRRHQQPRHPGRPADQGRAERPARVPRHRYPGGRA